MIIVVLFWNILFPEMPLKYFYSNGCSVPELNSGHSHMQAQELPADMESELIEITLYGFFIFFFSVMSWFVSHVKVQSFKLKWIFVSNSVDQLKILLKMDGSVGQCWDWQIAHVLVTVCHADLQGLAKKMFRIDQDSTARETGKSFNIQEESSGALLLFLTTVVGHGRDTACTSLVS